MMYDVAILHLGLEYHHHCIVCPVPVCLLTIVCNVLLVLCVCWRCVCVLEVCVCWKGVCVGGGCKAAPPRRE